MIIGGLNQVQGSGNIVKSSQNNLRTFQWVSHKSVNFKYTLLFFIVFFNKSM